MREDYCVLIVNCIGDMLNTVDVATILNICYVWFHLIYSYTVCSPNYIKLCMLCTIMCSVDRWIDGWMNRYVFSHVNSFSYVAGLPGVLQGIRS